METQLVSKSSETSADDSGRRLPSNNNLLIAMTLKTDKSAVMPCFWRCSGPDGHACHECVLVWAERSNILTIRKQLRTLGSTLLPPNAATSPSCRGIWMASWSSRLRWRWSVKPPAPDTCRNTSASTRNSSFQYPAVNRSSCMCLQKELQQIMWN